MDVHILYERIKNTSRVTIVAAVFYSWILYIVGRAVYRLYLSPIAKFPGPKLAAVSRWYEFYYEVVLRGQYTFHIQDLHKKYGPIIRVSPDELHIDDPSFWETLYSKNPKAWKFDWSNVRFGNETSVFATSEPAHHRIRRNALAPFFSKRVIAQREPMIREKLEFICDKLNGYHERDQILRLDRVWDAFSGDVISEYAFGFNYNNLASEDFKDTFHDPFLVASEFGHVIVQFPLMGTILNSLPGPVIKAMDPTMEKLVRLKRDLAAQLVRVKLEVEQGYKPDHLTIFHEMITSDLPAPEKEISRMRDEAQTVLGAGLLTTGWALSQLTFYVLNDPEVYAKLRKELWEAIPDINAADAFEMPKLETLPYLRGCIREGIRHSDGISGRTQRISKNPLQYNEWTIPADVPVSMTARDVHFNPEIYPNPNGFVPERWLGTPKAPDGSSLERYFVAFGKGPRMCLGMNLAWAELYLATAMLFRRFRFELYETDASDVVLKHDFFIPSPKLDTKGVRVKVVKIER